MKSFPPSYRNMKFIVFFMRHILIPIITMSIETVRTAAGNETSHDRVSAHSRSAPRVDASKSRLLVFTVMSECRPVGNHNKRPYTVPLCVHNDRQ